MAYSLRLLKLHGCAEPVAALIVDLGVPRQMPAMQRFIDSMVGIGWALTAAPLSVSAVNARTIVATVNFTATGMQLRTDTDVNDGILADDLVDGSPALPTGWWDAVHRAGDSCVVVMVDVIDLHRPRKVRHALRRASSQGTVLVGAAAVTHSTPPVGPRLSPYTMRDQRAPITDVLSRRR